MERVMNWVMNSLATWVYSARCSYLLFSFFSKIPLVTLTTQKSRQTSWCKWSVALAILPAEYNCLSVMGQDGPGYFGDSDGLGWTVNAGRSPCGRAVLNLGLFWRDRQDLRTQRSICSVTWWSPRWLLWDRVGEWVACSLTRPSPKPLMFG